MIEIVILDPDRRTQLRLPLDSATSSLSILQCRVRRADFAAMPNDSSNESAVLNDQCRVKIDKSTNVISELDSVIWFRRWRYRMKGGF
jgi:hypothetical protein